MENQTISGHAFNGMIMGIIDAQFALCLIVANQLGIEPGFIADIMARTAAAAEAQGGHPDFVANRKYAPLALHETLSLLASANRRPGNFVVVRGGVARSDSPAQGTPQDGAADDSHREQDKRDGEDGRPG